MKHLLLATITTVSIVAGAAGASIYDDAVAYWPFEGTGSTCADASATTPIDLLFSDASVTRVDGIVGQAVSSPVGAHWVTTDGDVDALDITRDDDLSWAGWVNLQSANMFLATKMLGSDTYRGWYININGDQTVQFILRSANTTNEMIWMKSAVPIVKQDAWTHLAVTYSYDETDDYRGVRMLVNGAEVPLTAVRTGLATAMPTENDVPYQMFARNGSGQGTGHIDEVGIWNRPLTQADIDEMVVTAPGRPTGNYLVNGDFEDLTGWGVAGSSDFPANWDDTTRKNPAAQMTGSGAIGGSGTSAYIEPFLSSEEATRRHMVQNTEMATLPEWQFDCDFACENPDDSAAARSFTCAVEHAGGQITLRVVDSDLNGVGDVQYYNNQADTPGWKPIPELLNTVIFDENLWSDPATHALTVLGHYADETPNFDILLTNSDGTEYAVYGLAGYTGDAPVFGQGADGVNVASFVSRGGFTIDNVSLMDVIDDLPVLEGDLNGDGFVGSADLDIVRGAWGQAVSGGAAEGDPSGDGVVGSADLDIVRANWGATAAAAVPEPAAAALLLCAAAFTIVRRKTILL